MSIDNTQIKAEKLVFQNDNESKLGRLATEVALWATQYELNFQHWPNQHSVWIGKRGVNLNSFEGRDSIEEVYFLCCEYLRKINPSVLQTVPLEK